ncbi:hypothetical protein B0H14DRAFT_3486601 [Mycena olivaceomarginata]|nr:hypothetical protein B0H14DRAFT_3486601 [Mycena olivaceomarginata]
MVHASTLFLAVLAAVTSTSAWARPVIAREPAGFKIDTPCLGLNYLFGGPHHGTKTDHMLPIAPTVTARAVLDSDEIN